MLASLAEQIWHHVSGIDLHCCADWQINFLARFLSKKESGCVTSVINYMPRA